MRILPASHVDHVLAAHLRWLEERFRGRTAFFLETVEIPEGLPPLSSALYGPLVGDPPVLEAQAEITYRVRAGRSCASRMILGRPERPSRLCTVIAGPHEDHPCVLYTAYGGPAAPREPGDTSLATWEEVLAARAFWAEHALAGLHGRSAYGRNVVPPSAAAMLAKRRKAL